MTMRIGSGELKGRTLHAPKGSSTRPTSARLKKSLFDVLSAEVPGARVLDLFAGAGALGLESLSRGAVEAVVEDMDVKKSLFARLDDVLRADAIRCTNTSSLCVTELAASTRSPQLVAGLHFFNPVPLMPVVEIIPTLMSREDLTEQLVSFAGALGKTPVIAPDRPGFLVNRLLVPYLLDAVRALEDGTGTKEDIDTGMKLGCGHPMGPFELLDFVGLDTALAVADIMYDEFRETRFAPPPLLKRMVLAGRLGRSRAEGSTTMSETRMNELNLNNFAVDVDGGIATVRVDRPKKLNALNRETVDELDRLVEALAASPEVQGVIVTGSGDKAFVAGADIRELAEESVASAQATSRRGQEVFRKLELLTKPVIAAVNGFALGGGLELALACHIRVVSESAKLGLPEVTLGVIPGYGGTQRLARLVGRGRALELILTGAPVDAAEAHRLGIANRVVPDGELLDECGSMIKKMLRNGPLALARAIEAVDQGLDGDLESGMFVESTLFGILFGTQDLREGMGAFLEKRKPTFRGE